LLYLRAGRIGNDLRPRYRRDDEYCRDDYRAHVDAPRPAAWHSAVRGVLARS
jgi:hypothetical protein